MESSCATRLGTLMEDEMDGWRNAAERVQRSMVLSIAGLGLLSGG